MRAILIALAALSPLPALAHAMLEGATPAVGSVVHTAPAAITLDFSETLEPSFCRVVVSGPDGKPVDKADLHADPAHPGRLILGLGQLADGRYTVTWRAISVDTHKTEGRYHFTVGED